MYNKLKLNDYGRFEIIQSDHHQCEDARIS